MQTEIRKPDVTGNAKEQEWVSYRDLLHCMICL